jgi:putative DNA primase/helicase
LVAGTDRTFCDDCGEAAGLSPKKVQRAIERGYAEDIAEGQRVLKRQLRTEIGAASPAEAKEEIERLAKVPKLEYAQTKKGVAKELGISLKELEGLVKEARGSSGDTKGQGRTPSIQDVKPWSEPVDLAATLEQAVEQYERYLILPPAAAEKMALFSMLTHAFDCFAIVPRLLVTAATRACAKSLLLRILKSTTARAVIQTNANIAPLFHMITKCHPTIMLDEADRYLNQSQELLSLLNDGYAKGGVVWRCEGEGNEVKEFDAFTPVVIAMIKRPDYTLLSRSLVINMERKKSGDRTENFRGDRVHSALLEVQRKFARAAIDYGPQLREADPEMGSLFNRDADNWRPLFAIADLAGGRWPEHIRKCALQDISDGQEEETDEKLLTDIRWIFDGGPITVEDGGEELKFGAASEEVASESMCKRLAEMEGRPWGDWGKSGKPITQTALARRLKEFKIATRNTRFGSLVLKAYHLSDFKDAFERYLTAPPSEPLQRYKPTATGTSGTFEAATRKNGVAAEKSQKSLRHGDCSGVALQNPPHDDVGDFLDGEGWNR